VAVRYKFPTELTAFTEGFPHTYMLLLIIHLLLVSGTSNYERQMVKAESKIIRVTDRGDQ
jgi:hypothetical protein